MCDLNPRIGVNARVVVTPFTRRPLWCICAAVSVGSQSVFARFARRHLWGICAAVSVGSQCVVARFARRHLTGICAAVSVGSQYVLARFARRRLWGICAAVSVGSQCVVTRCIMPTALDTMPPAVRPHNCVLCCTHTCIESPKCCPKSLDANVCGRTTVLAGTASCRCKGLPSFAARHQYQ